ncbi:hypothetical protein Halru_2218 [Halovivax ruber XH-70]|uniref:Uncharacterized protein n=1 Tax=Halovivax ruber (strain DSM 18193 / JCM 13892 / XH-70) TaxID=797302 RepID=L0IB84_HALRX|nr:hypothetical protein [Halovivax ruber]AGB16805.1 hypothetical protein Halru_2218 [Halovivax ruber XH-70]
MPLQRRTVIAGLGLLGSCGALAGWLWRRDAPNHAIVVASLHEASHEVTVQYELGADEQTFGPTELAEGESWQVAHIETRGDVTVRFWVDGELAWEDTHEIPALEAGRSSIVLFEIQPDGEFLHRVKVED